MNYIVAMLLLCPLIARAGLTEEQVQKAIAFGAAYKNEGIFFEQVVGKGKLTKRNMITATKDVYVLDDSLRISYAAAYGNARLAPLSLERAKSMAVDGVQVMMKISAWGAGIAKEAANDRSSILVLTSKEGRIVPETHAFWIGSSTAGLPIYQVTTVGPVMSVNPIGSAFAHADIFLSSFFLINKLSENGKYTLAVFRLGDTKPVAPIDLSRLFTFRTMRPEP